MINRNFLAAAIAALSLQSAMPAAAADEDGCCFRLTPYYWAVGIDGSLENNRGATTDQFDFSSDIGDVSDNLDYNGSLLLEHHKGSWASYAQIDKLQVNNSDTRKFEISGVTVSPDLQTDSTLASAATGYRFHMSERSTIDLMVGVRYAKLDVEAKTRFGSVDGDSDLVDGIVMLRPRLALGKHWAFSPTLSAGAGDSDLVWEMAPELVYTNDCCNLEVRFGYRSVNYEYEEGNRELDFSYAGPMVGMGFAF